MIARIKEEVIEEDMTTWRYVKLYLTLYLL